jgi:hypothetical protein
MAAGWNEGAVFTQAQIDFMRVALTKACKALAFAFPSGNADDAIAELLASAILEAAAGGEASPLRLCAVALSNLSPIEAVYAGDLSFEIDAYLVSSPSQAEVAKAPHGRHGRANCSNSRQHERKAPSLFRPSDQMSDLSSSFRRRISG